MPIRSGNTFGNHGPQAKIARPAPSASPPSMATSSSRDPLRRPNDARPIRMDAALLLEHPRHRLDGAPRPHHPGSRFVERDTEVVKTDPGPPVGHLIRAQGFVGRPERVPVRLSVLDVVAGRFTQNQVAGVEEQAREQTVAPHVVPLGPLPDGIGRPAGPEPTVRPVAVRGAYAPRFAARCLAGVAGAVGIDHRDAGAETLQIEGGPHSERTGSDNDDIRRPARLQCCRTTVRRRGGRLVAPADFARAAPSAMPAAAVVVMNRRRSMGMIAPADYARRRVVVMNRRRSMGMIAPAHEGNMAAKARTGSHR